MNASREKLLNYLLEIKTNLNELYDAWKYERSKRWLNRRWLIRPFKKKRLTSGFYTTIFREMKEDEVLFFKYTRMNLQTFNQLLKLVKPHVILLRKRVTNINAEERLLIALKYLAAGDEISSIAIAHRIGERTVSQTIKDTCRIIQNVLSLIYLKTPSKTAWRNISKGFWSQWNLSNCIGAIDGKHIAIEAPDNPGSLFFNYKKFHSVILLAVCNHRYEFAASDVGAYGSESNGGVFARSQLSKALEEGSLDILEETPNLPNTEIKTPFYFVGDEAFKMTTNMIRPYPGRHLDEEKRIFNYKLSRARRCIENAFGILSTRWRIFHKPIAFEPKDVDHIIVACVCLHNFLMAKSQKASRQNYFCDIERNEISNNSLLCSASFGGTARDAHNMRDLLKDYLVPSEGEVFWQKDYINRGRHHDL